jgi:hypothetical protein
MQGADHPAAGRDGSLLKRVSFEVLFQIDIRKTAGEEPPGQGYPFPFGPLESASLPNATDGENDGKPGKRRQSRGQRAFIGLEPVHAELEDVRIFAIFLQDGQIPIEGPGRKAEAEETPVDVAQKSLL